jgi:non-ribosomal peptide synthetase component F
MLPKLVVALQGVEVCHGGVVNLLHYYRTATAPIRQGSMFFQTMPFIFDGSIMDIWLPLSMGCGIVVAPADDIKDPDIARSLIKQHGVVFLMITPSQFQVCTCLQTMTLMLLARVGVEVMLQPVACPAT